MMNIKIILEKTNTGYSAYSKDLPGAISAGESIEEVKENFEEVRSLLVDDFLEQGKVQQAKELKNAKFMFYLDLKTFFEYYSLFNKSELAKYLGLNPSHLRRLSSQNIELSEQKSLQIQRGLHQLADDLKQFYFA
ncbi:type II toxin-antitoxin system HicB family antitoxin [Ornithobacterium rhinotracheale]|uniref:type II toxin-antitoxin system HicB family antitoxin n=1 Tax=Ornithobacterium rhinotracheale TaxID=28251 RepID=UPI00129C9BE7|nr:type II toxin-antitoxin system HicB family antitoxin [Ornithobacterium rhinotracheale]MRI64182.1 type II toxin-antitoxin system HicB family antitoxin [Ornithobacterium rhinotracheale]